MIQNITTDKITISVLSEQTNSPPPLDKGGMDVVAISHWCLIGEDWYRWTGRNSVLLYEAVMSANLFTANEWIDVMGQDLERWVELQTESSPSFAQELYKRSRSMSDEEARLVKESILSKANFISSEIIF